MASSGMTMIGNGGNVWEGLQGHGWFWYQHRKMHQHLQGVTSLEAV